MVHAVADWLVAFVLAHPVWFFGAWGGLAAVGHMARMSKRAGVTLVGVGVVLFCVGWLWKRREDVGRGVVVAAVAATGLAWALAIWKLPDLRWKLVLPVTAVAAVFIGLPRWGWLDSTVGDRPLLGWVNDRLEGSYNRRAISAVDADMTVGKGTLTPSGWEYNAHVNGDPTAKLDPHEIGGRVNRGHSTARQVTVVPHPELGRATVTVSAAAPPAERTPWEMIEAIGPVSWVGPSSLRADDPVVIGFDVHGQPMRAAGPDPDSVEHVGCAGATRRGKSTTMAVGIAEFAFRPDVALVLVDPVAVEFAPWAPRATAVFSGVDGCRSGVEAIYRQVMLPRLERMAAMGRRTAPLGPGWPRVVVFGDEIAAFIDVKTKEGRAAQSYLTMISEQGGKAGIQLWLATQRPEVGVWEGRLRDNLLTRIGHLHTSGEGSRMTTGHGGPDLTSIPKSLRGGYLMFSDADWTPGRSLLLTPRRPVPADEKSEGLAYAAAEIAAATAHLRIPWGGLLCP